MAKSQVKLEENPGDNDLDLTGTEDDPKASEAELNAALISGHDNKDYGMKESKKPEEKDDPQVPDVKADKVVDDKSVDDAEKKKLEDEEWAGVSPAIRAKFTQMEASVAQANNAAKSASGRFNKLQSELDKSSAANKPKPQPTSKQITEAMGSPEKLKELEDQWPDLVAGINEGLNSVSNAVGDQIDKANKSMMEAWANTNRKSQEELLNRIKLDNTHPDWENTISNEGFKTWLYEGGPNPQEIGQYDQLMAVANAGKKTNTPEQTAVLMQQANDYYDHLLVSHTTWAAEKGNLYGSPSGDAAIKLLNMHKTSIEAKDKLKDEQGKDTRKKRLADNITPTDGRGVKTPPDQEGDAESAFLEGFKNPSY